MPNVTIPVNSKWATLTIALFTQWPGPLFLQGNEDHICKIWDLPFLIYNALLVLSQGFCPFSHPHPPPPTPPSTLSQGFTWFLCPRLSKSQTQTPAAQLVCLTVCQSVRILFSYCSPASAGESYGLYLLIHSLIVKFLFYCWQREISFDKNSGYICAAAMTSPAF